MAVKVGDDSYVAVLRFGPADKNTSEVRLSITDVHKLAETNGLPSTPISRMIKGGTEVLLFASPVRAARLETEAEMYRSYLNELATNHTT